MGHQFHQVISMALGTAYLIPLVARPSWPGRMTFIFAGLGLALLPLCGGTGLLFVPGLELWMFGMAVATLRSPDDGRWLRVGTLALAMLPGLAVTALYFRGFRGGLFPDAPGGMTDNVRTGLQFLTGGIGTPGAVLWPWSGVVTFGLIALSVVLLVRAWLVRPDERPRIFGLAAFLASMLSIAGAVGWGRGWSGSMAGFQDRFITMAVPLWCWFAMVFRLYTPSNLGQLALNILFAALCRRHGRMRNSASSTAAMLPPGTKRFRVMSGRECRLIVSSRNTHRFSTQTRTSFPAFCRSCGKESWVHSGLRIAGFPLECAARQVRSSIPGTLGREYGPCHRCRSSDHLHTVAASHGRRNSHSVRPQKCSGGPRDSN